MRVFNSYNIFLAIIEIPYTVAEQTIVTNRLVHLKFNFLENQIEIIPFEEFEDKYREARNVSPDDVPYLALALKLNCAIWSNQIKATRCC